MSCLFCMSDVLWYFSVYIGCLVIIQFVHWMSRDNSLCTLDVSWYFSLYIRCPMILHSVFRMLCDTSVSTSDVRWYFILYIGCPVLWERYVVILPWHIFKEMEVKWTEVKILRKFILCSFLKIYYISVNTSQHHFVYSPWLVIYETRIFIYWFSTICPVNSRKYICVW